jgi:hypothetical protein
VLTSVLFALPFEGWRNVRPQPIQSSQMKISFPPDVVQCVRGDYLIREAENHALKVFLVEDLFVMNRLVALRKNDLVSLHNELDFYDSAVPPDWGKIKVLVSEYQTAFPSLEKAIAAIESGRLGDSIEGLCRSINYFPKNKARLYRKKQAGSA